MEDITVTIENEDTTEVRLTEETTVLVREYVGGKNISIEDNVINCTYEYQLPASVVMDNNYVHTDNNFTTAEKEKLANLENADLSDYYTKSQTDQAITDSMGDYYTKQEVRKMILDDLESYYTREEIDIAFKNYYTKTELDAAFANYYKKAEVDDAISSAVSTSATSTKKEVLDAVALDYYNKTEVNNLIATSGGGGGGGGASTASEVSITDANDYFYSTDVEGALQELGRELVGLAGAVNVQSGVVS